MLCHFSFCNISLVLYWI